MKATKDINETKSFNLFKTIDGKTKIVILSAIAVVVSAVICVIIFAPSGKTTFSVETSLKEVLLTSDLLTSEYTYKSIAKVEIDNNKSEDDGNVKYQVSYNGIVKSGFDFNEIKVVEDKTTITVIIPKIMIKDVSVDTDLDYIFSKKKYDTEKTYQEAYRVCCEDLEEKAKSNTTLYKTAIESAKDTVTAITKPFNKNLEKGKSIKVVYIDEYNARDKK